MGGMAESQCSTIRMDDLDYQIFFVMIKFIYSNTLDLATISDKLLDLLVLADRYMLDDLKNLVIESFKDYLTVDNFDEIFIKIKEIPLIDERFPGLLPVCNDFIIEKWDRLVTSDRYKLIPVDFMNMSLAVKIQ